jgi:L-fuculose-phosphate aldolase
MANHGATGLGKTIAKARWRLEVMARTFVFSRIGDAPHIPPDAGIDDVLVAFQNYGPHDAEKSEIKGGRSCSIAHWGGVG